MFAAKSQKNPEDFLTYLATYLSQTMDITHLRHLIAAFTQLLFPSPNIPPWYFFCKPFIMTAIHNTSPSSGFYFPYESVTTSSCYPSPPPPPHSALIDPHTLSVFIPFHLSRPSLNKQLQRGGRARVGESKG